MLNEIIITNAGVLLLIIGWTFIGSAFTFIAMTHYADRVGHREYLRGCQNTHEWHDNVLGRRVPGSH